MHDATIKNKPSLLCFLHHFITFFLLYKNSFFLVFPNILIMSSDLGPEPISNRKIHNKSKKNFCTCGFVFLNRQREDYEFGIRPRWQLRIAQIK
jgi:hypothetical protein